MKASKKVMESVIVSGLALTLAVTAVTGNGVNIAAKDAADTQFVNNGIAGVASAMNEYELESADYLDRYISVEKTNAQSNGYINLLIALLVASVWFYVLASKLIKKLAG